MTAPRFAPHPDVLLSELDPIEGVLLNAHTRDYFSLNETGLVLWKALAAGQTTDQAAEALCAGFTVEPEEARAYALAFAREVEAAGLLRSTRDGDG